MINLMMFEPLLSMSVRKRLTILWGSITFIAVIVIYFFAIPYYEESVRIEGMIEQQQKLLASRQAMAADLPKKRQEFADLEKRLTEALAMLPKKSQIPDLLEQVSWSVKDSGLQMLSFEPKAEIMGELYAEVPVNFSVRGSYRQFMFFLKSVGEIPRIVLIKNIKIDHKDGAPMLDIQGQVTTYRFVEASEKPSAANKQ
ncbi:MAG: type 4a pilus biogenesis protein PilO [Zetaproteobacteria bacterium]|nr:type 4a pilus biogenesis protein PilO [Zetaproteobacteria bacterium]